MRYDHICVGSCWENTSTCWHTSQTEHALDFSRPLREPLNHKSHWLVWTHNSAHIPPLMDRLICNVRDQCPTTEHKVSSTSFPWSDVMHIARTIMMTKDNNVIYQLFLNCYSANSQDWLTSLQRYDLCPEGEISINSTWYTWNQIFTYRKRHTHIFFSLVKLNQTKLLLTSLRSLRIPNITFGKCQETYRIILGLHLTEIWHEGGLRGEDMAPDQRMGVEPRTGRLLWPQCHATTFKNIF